MVNLDISVHIVAPDAPGLVERIVAADAAAVTAAVAHAPESLATDKRARTFHNFFLA